MPLWPKLGSHIDVNLLPETSGVIQIEYMTDRTEPDWRSLGTASEPGRTRFYFGSNFVDGNGGEYDETTIGIPFDWIEFRYTFEGDAGNTLSTPLADSFVFKFIKIPLQTLSWSLNVPIMFDEQYYDVGPRELYERLRELASAEEFVPLVYKDETFRVLVAQTQADSFSGGNPHARFKLILLEVS